MQHLNEDCIVSIGTFTRPGDILVVKFIANDNSVVVVAITNTIVVVAPTTISDIFADNADLLLLLLLRLMLELALPILFSLLLFSD